MLAPWKKSYDQPRQHTKKLRRYFADKSLSSQKIGRASCRERVETVADFIFVTPKSLQMVTAAMKFKDNYSLEGKL